MLRWLVVRLLRAFLALVGVTLIVGYGLLWDHTVFTDSQQREDSMDVVMCLLYKEHLF